jgi:hypothetical protein
MTFIRHNNAAGQPSGTAVGTGASTNTGGISGYAINSTAIGTGSAFTFDDGSAPGLPPGATACYKMVANGSGNAYFQWVTPPSITTLNMRIWVYFSGTAVAQRVLDWQGGGNNPLILQTASASGMKWQLFSASAIGGSFTQNGTTPVAANTWYMVDVQFTQGWPGGIVAKIYDSDGITLAETITLSNAYAMWNTALIIGWSTGVTATTYYALPAMSDQGWIGNADLSALPQSKLFTADGGSLTSSWAYRATPATFSSTGTVTSYAVTKQANTAAGDWIIMYVYSGGTTVTCTGFQIKQDTNKYGALIYRYADGSEGGTFTINFSGSGYAISGVIVTVSGATGMFDTLTPSAAGAAATQTMTANAIGPVNPNNLLLWFGADYDGTSGYVITQPSGFGNTHTNTTVTLPGSPAVMVADKTLAISGTTGAQSGSCTSSATVATAMCSLCGTTQGPVVGNSSQASSGDPFDYAVANNPGSQYSTTYSAEGGMSVWFPSGKVNLWYVANVNATWDLYMSFYFVMNAAPTGGTALLIDVLNQANTSTCQIGYQTNNRIIVNATSAISAAGTYTYTAQYTYRVSAHWHVDSSAGYGEYSSYDGVTGVFIEHVKTATNASNTGLNLMDIGPLTGTTTGVWLDYLQLSDQYPPAPAGGWQAAATPLALSGFATSSSGSAFFDFL